MTQTIFLATYDVVLGPIKETLASYLDHHSYQSICLLVDENTKDHCLPLVSDIIDTTSVIEINSGEKNKTLQTCEHIWGSMVHANMDRHSLLINLGGGVIGDMGGFAASCFMRGIDFLQIPTTLLSQVDASIGGKLAVDFHHYKNFIGLFNNPKSVLVDPLFLKTQSPRQIRSGYAEMLKHGLIMDEAVWERLKNNHDFDNINWQEEIHASINIKKKVVEQDPKESGLRKILNFGHTIGHAIESISLGTDRPFLHGEAIGLGMMAETILSTMKCGLSSQASTEILTSIRAIYPDVDYTCFQNADEIIRLMKSDKKNKAGTILISLLNQLGTCTYDISVNEEEIRDCLQQTYTWTQNEHDF